MTGSGKSRDPAACPCKMQVIAAAVSMDIQQLTAYKESGMFPRLHVPGIDLCQCNPSCTALRPFKSGSPVDCKCVMKGISCRNIDPQKDLFPRFQRCRCSSGQLHDRYPADAVFIKLDLPAFRSNKSGLPSLRIPFSSFNIPSLLYRAQSAGRKL